jgi:hypothetical protein
VSLKSRIRNAQREAARRGKSDRRRHVGGKGAWAIFGSKDGIDDESEQTTPSVEEIRSALLRKSANGKVME